MTSGAGATIDDDCGVFGELGGAIGEFVVGDEDGAGDVAFGEFFLCADVEEGDCRVGGEEGFSVGGGD